MDAKKNCKVFINTLVETMWRDDKNDPLIRNPLFVVADLIDFIMKKSKKLRFYDLKDGKFCFIESVTYDNQNKPKLITGIFKSARNEFRPDLINKKTGNERRNPKELSEGDIEKTHFMIKIHEKENEVYLFLEYNFHGVHMNNIVNYFGKFFNEYVAYLKKKRNSSIGFSVILRNDFRQELNKLSRAKITEVYFNKNLLGSDALDFSNRTVHLNNEIKLVLSAKPQESIKETAVDIFNTLNGRKSEITKVRVYGKDEDNNEIMLDTSSMNMVEHIDVDLNQETGEVNSTQLFTGLRKIASRY